MRTLAWPAVAMLVAAACSPGPTSPTHPAPPPAEPPPAAAGPSERDCDALITHAVALGIDEAGPVAAAPTGAAAPTSAAARPASAAPGTTSPAANAGTTTQADHEAVRRSLREDFMTGCRALAIDAFRCALAAPTLTALAACQPPAR